MKKFMEQTKKLTELTEQMPTGICHQLLFASRGFSLAVHFSTRENAGEDQPGNHPLYA